MNQEYTEQVTMQMGNGTICQKIQLSTVCHTIYTDRLAERNV